MKINRHWIIRRLPISKAVKLRWGQHLLDQDWQRERRAAPQEEQEALNERWQFELHMHADEEREYYSDRLLRRAGQLRLITPDAYDDMGRLTDDYTRSTLTYQLSLSLQGENKLRAAIREEEKYRSEKWARRIPYITALTGLIGAVTGLVAVIGKLGH